MTRIFISRQAQGDAYAIWGYIAEDNMPAADKWSASLDEIYTTLAAHPRLGPARPDLGKGLRYFPFGSYLVLYHEVTDGIEIVRVLHGARNLEAIFHAEE